MEPNLPAQMLSNTAYNRLKFLALVILPAISTLYFAVGSIWGFPNIEQVVGTIAAADVFLGSLLGLAKRSYDNSDAPFDGEAIIIEDDDENKALRFDFNEHPYFLTQKDRVTLKVVKG